MRSCYRLRMRWSAPVCVGLSVALAASGWWVWSEHAQLAGNAFIKEKLAFVEEENRRLTAQLNQEEQAREFAVDATRRTEIEKAVVGLRGLSFLKPVIYRQIPRTELPNILRQKLTQQVPDQEFESEGVALSALGLLPAGVDLKKTYLALLGEQIGAFYDQHSGELYTFSGQSLENTQNRVILAHELTHALEDQHFHLAGLPLEAKGNDDQALSASALVEGDATLVMDRYMLDNMSSAVLRDSVASALTTDVRQFVAAPRYLRETLVFPYLKGQEFCQALYAPGGWQALAEAFRHPPSSTSQILHPERFFAQPRQEPLDIVFGEITVNGHQPIADNVAGEFGVRQLLSGWLKDDAKAAELAAHWTGDHYLVYGDAKTNSYLWKCAWASEDAARQFAAAAQVGWRTRYGVEPAKNLASEASRALTKTTLSCRLPDGRELRILQDHQLVTLEEAQDDDWLNALRPVMTTAPLPSPPHVTNH